MRTGRLNGLVGRADCVPDWTIMGQDPDVIPACAGMTEGKNLMTFWNGLHVTSNWESRVLRRIMAGMVHKCSNLWRSRNLMSRKQPNTSSERETWQWVSNDIFSLSNTTIRNRSLFFLIRIPKSRFTLLLAWYLLHSDSIEQTPWQLRKSNQSRRVCANRLYGSSFHFLSIVAKVLAIL